MIKIFRKIRYRLMEQNKTSKYIKYAIGEIILVVIGILIALQINNWNENKKSIRIAESYIKDIRKDLISDTLMYNAAIERARNTIAKNKAILTIEQPNTISSDSLDAILRVFHSMRIYQINNASYSKVLNTGFLESNVFSNLFTQINNYYTKEFNTYSEFIEWDKEQVIDYLHDDFLGDYKNEIDMSILVKNHSKAMNTEKVDTSLNKIKEFITSSHFRNRLLTNYTRKELIIDRILIQKQLAKDLLTRINQELPNND